MNDRHSLNKILNLISSRFFSLQNVGSRDLKRMFTGDAVL